MTGRDKVTPIADVFDYAVLREHAAEKRRVTRSLQPTCYPYYYSTVTEDGIVFDGSSRQGKARTRLNIIVMPLK